MNSLVKVSDDTLFAYNDFKRTLEKYFMLHHIESIGLPSGINLNSYYKFLYSKHHGLAVTKRGRSRFVLIFLASFFASRQRMK